MNKTILCRNLYILIAVLYFFMWGHSIYSGLKNPATGEHYYQQEGE